MKMHINSGQFVGYTPSADKTYTPVFELDITRRNGHETVYSTVLPSGVTVLSKNAPQVIPTINTHKNR